MARPRVLVSSTCEDLYVIREQLRDMIDGIGYEAILSEEGDVYFSPDLHVHLSCIREVRNCDMVVLIVGNRFGCELIASAEKSVTQAEHDTAYLSSIPIFAFIDQRVLHDYATYRRAVDEKGDAPENDAGIAGIPFGSHADVRVFRFIDSIKGKVTNNAFLPFSNFSDIQDALKKQWAGMLFDFLKQRSEDSKNREMLDLLGRLEIASSKVEQVVELIAGSTVPVEKQSSLAAIDIHTKEKRLSFIMQTIWNGFFLSPAALQKARTMPDADMGHLLDPLLSDLPPKEAARAFQKVAKDLALIGPKSGFMDISVKHRVMELREAVERKKATREDAVAALKETLLASLDALQGER